MTFSKTNLMFYKPNDLDYLQRFAGYAYSLDRLNKNDLDIISANAFYLSEKIEQQPQHQIHLRR